MSPSDTLLAAFRGSDGETDFLLEEWADGVRVMRTRPHDADGWTSWSAPVHLARRPIAEATGAVSGLCPCGQPNCSDAAVRS